jgi:hypothetical protein
MLQTIDKAIYKKFSVLILNPNNFIITNKQVKNNTTPEEHLLYIFDKFLKKSNKKIHIIGNFYATKPIINLINERKEDCFEKIKKIGLIDSIMKPNLSVDFKNNKEKLEWFKKVTKFWDVGNDVINSQIINKEKFNIVSSGIKKLFFNYILLKK